MQTLAGTEAVTRQTFWQIGPVGRALFYYLAAVAIAFFLYGVFDRFARYARGSEEPLDRLDDLGTRILRMAVLVGSNVGQFDRDRYAGAMHTAAFWGFLVLFVGTVILAIDMDVWTAIFGRPSFFAGDFYRSYSFVMDAFGGLFVVGIGMALLARYWFDTPRLHGPHTDLEDDLFVWTLFLLGTGGFLPEGVRLLARGFPSHETVSFVGLTIAIGLDGIGFSSDLAYAFYPALWWSHAVLALAFVAAIPYAKPVHMLTSFANVLTRDSKTGRR
ncbi:MAG: Fe-S oxidoreductase, partial [archaeon]